MIPLILGNPHIVVSTFFSFLCCWAQGSIKELFGPVPSGGNSCLPRCSGIPKDEGLGFRV